VRRQHSSALLDPNNKLFRDAMHGALRWPQNLRGVYPLAVLIAGLAIPFLGQLLSIPFFILLSPLVGDPTGFMSTGPTSLQGMLILVLSFAPIYLLVWLWLRYIERRPFETIGLNTSARIFEYGRGFLFGLLMFGSAVGLLALLGYIEIEAVDFGLAAWIGVATILIGWIVQGAAEEVVARGFMLPIIGARWRPWIGVLLSSSAFGLLHLLNPNLNWLAMLNLILFGFFAALYALWEEGLWGIFAIHSVWNWAQGNLFGFEVSGNAFGGDSLLDLTETGPDLLTGGAFGPEGGLVVTLVLLLSSLAVWLASRRRSSAADRESAASILRTSGTDVAELDRGESI
jgi:membrane protease YdiL (CAAX protease family)